MVLKAEKFKTLYKQMWYVVRSCILCLLVCPPRTEEMERSDDMYVKLSPVC